VGASEIELVRELFRRFSSGGLEAALGLISENARFEVPGSMSAEPDVYEGHDGARRYFAGFEGLMEDVRFEPLDFEEHGDALIVWMLFAGRGVTSGIDVEQHAAVIVTFEDGKVAGLEPHPDVETARAALR
jgi:ketosteroid isomerase-like protein